MTTPYPKRLIEVDLPIKEISVHARREKSIRHGHISTLHIWWARRPLAACRAVLCASLWPDPADPHCPQSFRDAAGKVLCDFAEKVRTEKEVAELCAPHWNRWRSTDPTRFRANDPAAWREMRQGLLDFIADFANWDASTVPGFIQTAVGLTRAANAALGESSPGRPLVVDPFAGGGAIPIEAIRVGADVFASDLNPIPVLLNKVLLEYVPTYGSQLATSVEAWGARIKADAERLLRPYYPTDSDGCVPVAYLWARTIRCEGPACGAAIPLVRSPWLSRRSGQAVALDLVPNRAERRIDVKIVEGREARAPGAGTVVRGSASCPLCGYTTPVASIRRQLKERRGGAADARLLAVVVVKPGRPGRLFRLPGKNDHEAIARAQDELRRRLRATRDGGRLSAVPDEEISLNELRRISPPLYGMARWGDLFTPRQALTLATLSDLVFAAGERLRAEESAPFATAVSTVLALAVDRLADISNSLCRWKPTMTQVINLFGRQAIPMMWDFAEASPLSDAAGDLATTVGNMVRVLERESGLSHAGHAQQANAVESPLPDATAAVFFTDPPYYDAVPYAHLSDFFYVWLRRSLSAEYPALFSTEGVPKDAEIVVDRPHELSTSKKGIAFYEHELARAFREGRRVTKPDGIGVIVFASKTTASWEAILQAVISAGWIITGSWPIDTEMQNRVAAQGQARLGSSVHLVCRPRESANGSVRNDEIGGWRDVLAELPRRIHDWVPRLADEGVVGADAIFACLGPALEIFSRYTRVEKASGEHVPLSEYLEQIWAAVSREALSTIFEDADATGLEEDARLTAMWLWTVGGGLPNASESAEPGSSDPSAGEDSAEDDEAESDKGPVTIGYPLEFDAARKIAQGLGAHLEKLTDVVEVKGDKARLLAVAERAKSLFSKDAGPSDDAPTRKKAKAKSSKKQLGLFAEVEAAEKEGLLGKHGVPKVGQTTLDRVHQAMILFGAGRSEALKRFVVEEGVGADGRFWKLAQSFSALYPSGSDEKRWVDGVLARKKGLGF